MGKLPANRATKAYHTEMKRILNNAPKRNPPKPSVTEAGENQSERFIAKARELGLDEREEVFDAALTSVARHGRSSGLSKSPLVEGDDGPDALDKPEGPRTLKESVSRS